MGKSEANPKTYSWRQLCQRYADISSFLTLFPTSNESISILDNNFKEGYRQYRRDFVTWPWKIEKKREQERRALLIRLSQELTQYEKEVYYNLALKEKTKVPLLTRISLVQRIYPWGINLKKNNLPLSLKNVSVPLKDYLLYRYGLPLWRFSYYLGFIACIFLTLAIATLLLATSPLGIAFLQGIGLNMAPILSFTPIVWLTTQLTFTISTLLVSAFTAMLLHREICNPGFFFRVFSNYLHDIKFNIGNPSTLIHSLPCIGELMTDSYVDLTRILPRNEVSSEFLKELLNPIRWLQKALTTGVLLVCWGLEGFNFVQKPSHKISSFLKFFIVTPYFALFIALEPLRALAELPFNILYTCIYPINKRFFCGELASADTPIKVDSENSKKISLSGTAIYSSETDDSSKDPIKLFKRLDESSNPNTQVDSLWTPLPTEEEKAKDYFRFIHEEENMRNSENNSYYSFDENDNPNFFLNKQENNNQHNFFNPSSLDETDNCSNSSNIWQPFSNC